MVYASWSVVQGEQPSATKWNILGTNDAHFYSFLGDNLAYQSWTPSYTNITVGNGAVTAKYSKVGKMTHAYWFLSFGSTSALSGAAVISLPTTVSANYTSVTERLIIGQASFLDATGSNFTGPVFIEGGSSTQVRLALTDTTTAFGSIANTSSTAPFTWTTSDVLGFDVTYETA